MVTQPSCSSTMRASRTGIRLTPRSSAMASWGTRMPGRSTPSKISVRMCRAMWSALLVRTSLLPRSTDDGVVVFPLELREEDATSAIIFHINFGPGTLGRHRAGPTERVLVRLPVPAGGQLAKGNALVHPRAAGAAPVLRGAVVAPDLPGPPPDPAHPLPQELERPPVAGAVAVVEQGGPRALERHD